MDATAAPAPQASPSPSPADQDPRNLHDLAVDVQTDIQKLATGLAHAGANPQVVQQITQISQVFANVSKVLAQGPDVENARQAGGPPPEAAQAPQQPATAAPQPPGAAAPQSQHHALHAATLGLHAAMIASKAAQAQQQGK